MGERSNGKYFSEPEHGLERHRLTKSGAWTPELRRLHAETSIRLSAARLEEPFDPDHMAGILNSADLVPQLGGMYFTLVGPNGESYARKAILWAIQDARRENVQLGEEVMKIAQGHLGTHKI